MLGRPSKQAGTGIALSVRTRASEAAVARDVRPLSMEPSMLDRPHGNGPSRLPLPRLENCLQRSTDATVVRLQVLSDLYLDHDPCPLPHLAAGVDAVVVAGNTAAGTSTSFALLRTAFPRPVPLVVVLGNLEFHGRPIGRERSMARRLALDYGITILDDTSAIVAGLRFVGSTLWTDYTLGKSSRQPEIMHAASSMEDHQRISLLREPWIRFTPYDALALHHASRRFLTNALADREGIETVVVTHHAPSLRGLPADHDRRLLDGCLASDLDGMIAASGVGLWVHGHGDRACDIDIAGTRVVSNPRGRGRNTRGFDPMFIVEVPRRNHRGLTGRKI